MNQAKTRVGKRPSPYQRQLRKERIQIAKEVFYTLGETLGLIIVFLILVTIIFTFGQ